MNEFVQTEDVDEDELVEEAELVNQNFDKELKQKVKERDMFRCQICGNDQNLQVAHIPAGYDDDREGKSHKNDQGHRGMGGKKSVNRPENLITLCEKHHSMLDKKKGKSITIDRWVSSDEENGLVVFDNQMRRIDKDDLYFYSIPPQETIQEAHEVHDKLMQSLDDMLDNFHSSLERLYWIKKEELYKGIPSPKSNEDFYQSFKDYYLNEVKSKFGTKLTLSSVYSYHTAIEPLINREDNPEERHKVKRGNLPALGTILNSDDASEEDKEKAVELAKGRQNEFKKFKRDLDIKDNRATRLKTCKSCIVPNRWGVKSLESEDGTMGKVGSNKPTRCSVSGQIVDFLNREQAERIAKNCDQFDPQD